MRGIWSERVLPFLLLAAIGAVMVPETAQAQYVGAKRCRPCHLAQFKSWQKTKMANAFELLRPGVRADAKRAHKVDPDKDYTADPKCVQCHVTGYGEPGGFVSLAKTPKLADVQCEVCHGPGKGYMKPNLMSLKNKNYKRSEVIAAGLVIPSVEVCGKCHNEKSPFYKPFDYEERKKQGIHESHPLKYNHD